MTAYERGEKAMMHGLGLGQPRMMALVPKEDIVRCDSAFGGAVEGDLDVLELT